MICSSVHDIVNVSLGRFRNKGVIMWFSPGTGLIHADPNLFRRQEFVYGYSPQEKRDKSYGDVFFILVSHLPPVSFEI